MSTNDRPRKKRPTRKEAQRHDTQPLDILLAAVGKLEALSYETAQIVVVLQQYLAIVRREHQARRPDAPLQYSPGRELLER